VTPRAEALLGRLPCSAKIIEIGPSMNPALPKSSGWNVRTLDHATRAELVAKYEKDPNVDTSRIEEVDYVWRGGSLAGAVPSSEHGSFDALIASHVIEHTPDLVAFLEAARILLKPSGVLGLAVPDKRYCFDFFVPLTLTGDVLNAHLSKRSRHTPGAMYTQLAYTVSNDGGGAWGQHPLGELRFYHELGVARGLLADSRREEGSYVDVHNWRFTPSAFRLVLLELAWLGLCDWKPEHLSEAVGCEFVARLRRGGTAWARALPPHEFQALRLGLLKNTVIEQRAQADWLLAGEPRLGLPPSRLPSEAA
jgi:SAM-dependent methyltransferase